MGWSFRDDLDLREIVEAESTGGMLNSEQQKAKLCRPFLTDIRVQDVLWYLCVPEKKKVTVVRVTGEYGYDHGIEGVFDSGPGYDFRSFRPCEAMASALDIDSEMIGPDVRRWLEVRRRMMKAGPRYAMILNECLGRINVDNGALEIRRRSAGRSTGYAITLTVRGRAVYTAAASRRVVAH